MEELYNIDFFNNILFKKYIALAKDVVIFPSYVPTCTRICDYQFYNLEDYLLYQSTTEKINVTIFEIVTINILIKKYNITCNLFDRSYI